MFEVSVFQQIDPNAGGGVDSFRAPRVVGDSSALPGRYGVFFAGQPEVERGTATRGSGCTIPVYQPAGCGSHSGQMFENLIEQAVEGCPKRGGAMPKIVIEVQ